MAVSDPNAVPALFDSLDATLADGALFLQDEGVEEAAQSYGASLSFDWSNMRLRIDAEGQAVVVYGQEALLEDIVKCLQTHRFSVPIYDSDYGAELIDVIGLPASLALVQVEQMTREALLVDSRILDVEVVVTDLGAGTAQVRVTVIDFNGLSLDVPQMAVRYGA